MQPLLESLKITVQRLLDVNTVQQALIHLLGEGREATPTQLRHDGITWNMALDWMQQGAAWLDSNRNTVEAVMVVIFWFLMLNLILELGVQGMTNLLGAMWRTSNPEKCGASDGDAEADELDKLLQCSEFEAPLLLASDSGALQQLMRSTCTNPSKNAGTSVPATWLSTLVRKSKETGQSAAAGGGNENKIQVKRKGKGKQTSRAESSTSKKDNIFDCVSYPEAHSECPAQDDGEEGGPLKLFSIAHSGNRLLFVAADVEALKQGLGLSSSSLLTSGIIRSVPVGHQKAFLATLDCLKTGDQKKKKGLTSGGAQLLQFKEGEAVRHCDEFRTKECFIHHADTGVLVCFVWMD